VEMCHCKTRADRLHIIIIVNAAYTVNYLLMVNSLSIRNM